MAVNTLVKRYYRVPDGNGGRGAPRGLVYAEVLNGAIQLGYALCSEVDSYNPAKGHLIAWGRFQSGKFRFDPARAEHLWMDVDPCFDPMRDVITEACKDAIYRYNKATNGNPA